MYKGRCTWLREARKANSGAALSLHPAVPIPPPSWALVPLAERASPPQVVELQQTLAQKDQALGKLEQSFRLMEEASYDGTFLWKVTSVTRRCHESACGRTVSLFSPGKASPGAQTPAAGGGRGGVGGCSALTGGLRPVRPVSTQAPGPTSPAEVVGPSPLSRVEQGLFAPGIPPWTSVTVCN